MKAPPTQKCLGFYDSFPLLGAFGIGQWGLGTQGTSSPSRAQTHVSRDRSLQSWPGSCHTWSRAVSTQGQESRISLSPQSMDTEAELQFRPRTGKAASAPLLPEVEAYLQLLLVIYLMNSKRYPEVRPLSCPCSAPAPWASPTSAPCCPLIPAVFGCFPRLSLTAQVVSASPGISPLP